MELPLVNLDQRYIDALTDSMRQIDIEFISFIVVIIPIGLIKIRKRDLVLKAAVQQGDLQKIKNKCRR